MTFFIESLGCAKNQVDSEQIIAALEQRGLRWVDRPDDARFIIVNTCGFITSAKEQSIETSLALKSSYPNKKVVMVGCLVQRYGRDLEQAMGEIDGFVGLEDISTLGDLILSLDGKAAPVSASVSAADSPPPHRTRFLSFPGSAYVKVADGCSNHCSYCAIPLIRGELASRSRPDILQEIEELLDRGVAEIVLIAQDLASYGRDRGRVELTELVADITSLKKDFWLRLLYLHPDHLPLDLLDVMAADARVLPYFDVPFQHASAEVLQRMGRKGSAEKYGELVQRIRTRLPDAILRSTFLVGFPGESEADMNSLLEFQNRCELDWVGVFTYSREEGTPAHNFSGAVEERVAQERKRSLEQAQIPITGRRLERHVGRRLDVLVEEQVKGEDIFLGRSYLQAPEVDGLVVVKARALEPGRIYPVRIQRRVGVDLEASVV